MRLEVEPKCDFWLLGPQGRGGPVAAAPGEKLRGLGGGTPPNVSTTRKKILKLPQRDPNPWWPLIINIYIYIYILAIFHFRFLINFDIFLVVGPLGGVPPPKPPCFFPGAAAPGPPRPSHSIYERFSNSKTVLFGRVLALKLVLID